MKYFQILLLSSILFQTILNAEIIKNVSLFDHRNRCIYNDYYIKDDTLYYRYMGRTTFSATDTNDYVSTIYDGYVYDTETEECYPSFEENMSKYHLDIVKGFLVTSLIVWSLI